MNRKYNGTRVQVIRGKEPPMTFQEKMMGYAEMANESFREGNNKIGVTWAEFGFQAWVKANE